MIVNMHLRSAIFFILLKVVVIRAGDSNSTSLTEESRALLNLIEESGPIQLVYFKEIKSGYVCKAKSLIPVKYKVHKLWSYGDGEVRITGRAAIVSGLSGGVVIGCEVSASTHVKEYKAFTYQPVWVGSYSEIVPNKLMVRGDILQYYSRGNYRNWYRVCFEDGNEEIFNRFAKYYCLLKGYENGRNLKYRTSNSYNRYRMTCSNELTFQECYRNQRLTRIKSYSSNSCQNGIQIQCTGEQYKDNSKPRIAEGKNLKSRLTIEPNRQIEENDNVIITCSTSFNLFHRKIVQLQMIDFKGQRHNLINSINDFSFNLTHIYSTFNYIATRDRINDTFICTVKDLLSQQISTPSTKILRYKMAFTKINYKVFNVLNQTGDNRLKYIEITDDTTRYYNADRLECQADSEHPMPQYSWTYITKIGEEKTVASRYLHLSDVERRIPVICRVSQEMLSDTFTGSINVTLTDFLEVNTTVYEEITLKMCGDFNMKKNIFCAKDEDLLLKSTSVSYINDCNKNINSCQLPMATDFIRNERCKTKKNKCIVALHMIKRNISNSLCEKDFQ